MLSRNIERVAKVRALLRGRLRTLSVDVKPGVPIQLPLEAHRRFWTGPHSDLKAMEFLAGAFPADGAFFDIGANVGVYSAALKAMTNGPFRAICFEPIPSTVHVLRRTLAANDVDARIEQVALSDSDGVLTLSAFGEGANNFWVRPGRTDVPLTEVPKRKLDDWMRDNPTVVPAAIKVDVEGHELAVLEGGAETIRKHRPRMMVECHCASFPELGVSADRLQRLLESFGYSRLETSDGAKLDLPNTRQTVHAFLSE